MSKFEESRMYIDKVLFTQRLMVFVCAKSIKDINFISNNLTSAELALINEDYLKNIVWC